jgi:signal transduction histidine kinase
MDGSVQSKQIFPYTPLLEIRPVRNFLIAKKHSELIFLDEDLQEIWFQTFYDFSSLPVYLYHSNNIYPDLLITHQLKLYPPYEWRIILLKSRFDEIKKIITENWQKAIKDKNLERSIASLSLLKRSVKFIYPEKLDKLVGEIERRKKRLSMQRKIKSMFYLLFYTFILFSFFFFATLFYKWARFKFAGRLNYEQIRKIESSFLHTMRKKAYLLDLTLQKLAVSSSEKGVQKYQNLIKKDLSTMLEFAKNCRSDFKGIPFRYFSMRRFMKRLKKALKTPKIDNIKVVIREIENLDKSLNTWRISLGETVYNTLKIVKSRCEELLSNIQVLLEMDPDFQNKTLLRGTSERLTEILANIVINGIEASNAKGDGKVLIRGEVKSSVAHLIIQDNGPGMDKDTLNRIWERGFSTKKTGVGLGLTPEDRLFLERLGGVEVTSTPGEGTQFVIKIK